MKKVQFSKQHYKTLSDREKTRKQLSGEAHLHKAVMISGTLRCGLCNRVIRPLHSKSSCCKASYKRYMQENEATQESSSRMSKKLEQTFKNIIVIAYDATDHNNAFEPEYGMDVLNDIRRELGLKVIDTGNVEKDIKTMERLLR